MKKAFTLTALACVMAAGLAACQSTASTSSEPFKVGDDSVVAKTDGASQYAPTFTVNVKILGGSDKVLFNGTVKLTSDTMWASEFTYQAVNEKGLSQDGISTGFVNTIGDYTNGNIGSDYYYWNYQVNNVQANWGCNAYQMRDGDYLFWSFIKYVAAA